MTLGPVEVLVIAFPENNFNGKIIPEIQALIERQIITVVDGLLITKDAEGDVAFLEFGQAGADEGLALFGELMAETVYDLFSDEDVEEFAVGLEPNSSAAMLAFEHTWAKPFRDAIVDSGGILVSNVRIPGIVIDEVLAAVANAE